MTEVMIYTMIAVPTAVALALVFITRYPRKIIRRTLICPETTVLAEVSFLRREGSWGNIEATDVVKCSLFPREPVTCDKRCLMR